MTPNHQQAAEGVNREKCGKPAESMIPKLGISRACVLDKGHAGDCRGGGTCLKHGEYVGPQCPQWPDCCKPPFPEPSAGQAAPPMQRVTVQTGIVCPGGCGGFLNVGDSYCRSCRCGPNEQRIKTDPNWCWEWFGPMIHRMKCRRHNGHEGEHYDHPDSEQNNIGRYAGATFYYERRKDGYLYPTSVRADQAPVDGGRGTLDVERAERWLREQGFDLSIKGVSNRYIAELLHDYSGQAAPPAAAPEPLEQVIARKTAEIEAVIGPDPWPTASPEPCRWCAAGMEPCQSSVSDAMVHTDTPVGRVICDDKSPSIFHKMFPGRTETPSPERRCVKCNRLMTGRIGNRTMCLECDEDDAPSPTTPDPRVEEIRKLRQSVPTILRKALWLFVYYVWSVMTICALVVLALGITLYLSQ